jgi:hypothetical protein
MFPLIPLFALFAILGGGATLVWYEGLSSAEQQEADRIAADYARTIFDKSMKELTSAEAARVASLTERHFAA